MMSNETIPRTALRPVDELGRSGRLASLPEGPHDADFEPARLHDWQELLPAMAECARLWKFESV